jgi:hypothetical protein
MKHRIRITEYAECEQHKYLKWIGDHTIGEVSEGRGVRIWLSKYSDKLLC